MQMYYWPTSYSIPNSSLYGMTIPTGLVDMTGWISVLAGVPGSTRPRLLPARAPRSTGLKAAPLGIILAVVTLWAATSGVTASTADASSSNATFDDNGLTGGSATVNIVGQQSAISLTVSNSAGTYTFSGTGSIQAAELYKSGSGTLLVNNSFLAPVSVTAGLLGGTGSIGPLTVASGGTVTPGATSRPRSTDDQRQRRFFRPAAPISGSWARAVGNQQRDFE